MRKADLTMIAYKAIDKALESCTAGNPLEVWARFVDILDATGRRAGNGAVEDDRS